MRTSASNPNGSPKAKNSVTVNSSILTISPSLPSSKARVIAPRSLVESLALRRTPPRAFSLRTRCPRGIRAMPAMSCPSLPRSRGRLNAPRHRSDLRVHSVAGDLGINDKTLRQALHERGILTVGIPKTIAPIQANPSPEEVRDLLNEAGLHRQRTPHQVRLACACGYSRPVVESHIASLLSRGAGHVRYKGHPGAVLQLGMTAMAHNGAVVVRIRQQRLSKRAQKFRRWLGLRHRKINGLNDHQLKAGGLRKDFGGLNRRLKETAAESRWFETTGQAPFGRAKAAYWKINDPKN